MKKDAFTLIELVAVIAILCVIFLFIAPKLINVIDENEAKTKEIAETKVIEATKEYVTSYNTKILDNLVSVGNTSNVTLSELITAGLIDKEDTEILGTGVYIQVKLQEEDKLTYTVIYP